ncbi:MAG: radical SAM protein [candidate division WOR-3 bacterium]
MFKFGKYVFTFPYSKNNNFILAYSYVKNSLVIFYKDDLKKIIDSIDKVNNNSQVRFSNFDLYKLERSGILVKGNTDEEKEIKEILERGKFTNDTLYLVITYTFKCNMECVYCFQQNLEKIKLNEKDKIRIIEWVRGYLKKNNFIKKVYINLFGGEPLLDLESFYFFIKKIKEICLKENLDFGFSFTTNGMLMENIDINSLKNEGLKGIQFTLDGPKNVHNKRRKSKSGVDSYEKIMRSLEMCCRYDDLDILLEVNFDKQNIFSLPILFDELIKRKIEGKITLSPEPVMPYIRNHKLSSDNLDHYELYGLDGEELINAYKYILREIIQRNMLLSPTLGRFYPCTFTHSHHLIIGPDKKIYKCAFMCGFEEFSIGDIEKNTLVDKFRVSDIPSKCFNCKFLPICGGGCRYKSWLKYKSFRKIYCEKKLLEEIQPILIEYKYNDKIEKFIKNIS